MAINLSSCVSVYLECLCIIYTYQREEQHQLLRYELSVDRILHRTRAQKKKIHEKNDVAEVSKNLGSYRSENNFVEPSK